MKIERDYFIRSHEFEGSRFEEMILRARNVELLHRGNHRPSRRAASTRVVEQVGQVLLHARGKSLIRSR